MAQAGFADVIDDKGKHDEGDYGRSDQIYNHKQGTSLLPWIPDHDGSTWGYTSVPPEGCLWWETLPTRKPPELLVHQGEMVRQRALVNCPDCLARVI